MIHNFTLFKLFKEGVSWIIGEIIIINDSLFKESLVSIFPIVNDEPQYRGDITPKLIILEG